MSKITKIDSSTYIPQRDKIKKPLSIKDFEWTEKQKDFIDIALNKNTSVMIISGPAGTSKTLLSSYCCLQLLSAKKISDIIYIRSAVESSDSKLGYLPGSADDKLLYYGMPFHDKLGELLHENDIKNLVNDQRVSVFPINFARGMSWNVKGIIADETQNFTQEEILTLITRLGKHSKLFIIADPDQSDLKRDKRGGFNNIQLMFNDKEAEKFGIKTFSFTEDDIMRSELVKYIVKRAKAYLPSIS